MELNPQLRLIWAAKKWLALFAVAAAVVVYLVSSSKTDEYESNALGQIISTSQAEGTVLNEEELLSLSNVYDELATTQTVLDIAHKDSAVAGRTEEFDETVDVSPESRIGVLSFKALTDSPERSAEFANAYARAFAVYLGSLQVEQLKKSLGPLQEQVNSLEEELLELPSTDPDRAGLEVELQALQERIASQTSNPGDSLRIVEQAAPESTPVSPQPKRDAILAFIIALLLGAGAVYLRDLFFDRYGSAQDAARDLDLQLLGEIPRARKDTPLEAFRSLRTAITFALDRVDARALNAPAEGGRTILITGPESGCGKSYVSSNVARTLATEGRRVIAVDADLRRPTLHEIFKTKLSPGLSDLLVDESEPEPEDVMDDVRVAGGKAGAGLRLLPAGDHTDEAVESLSSRRMGKVVRTLQDDSEVVLFDSPPALAVVDPVVLSRWADGVVFVIDSRHTRRREARRAIEALRATGAPLLGFAFNRSSTKQSAYEAYRPHDPRRSGSRPSQEARV
ncbi:MAG TPA: AAA family ATPase [Solirubrobacterales bacterium]|nr:AAA family ATPase [Solirubrobacterales bacterium]